MSRGELFRKLDLCKYTVGVRRVEEWLMKAKEDFPDFSKESYAELHCDMVLDWFVKYFGEM